MHFQTCIIVAKQLAWLACMQTAWRSGRLWLMGMLTPSISATCSSSGVLRSGRWLRSNCSGRKMEESGRLPTCRYLAKTPVWLARDEAGTMGWLGSRSARLVLYRPTGMAPDGGAGTVGGFWALAATGVTKPAKKDQVAGEAEMLYTDNCSGGTL